MKPLRSSFKKPLRASLTIEAALVLPLFMFFIAAITYLLVIISLQSDIQLAMEEAARSLGKTAYLTKETYTDTAINYLTIRNAVLTDELKEEIDNSQIKRGTNGVSSLLSSYDEDSGILDIVLTYTYDIPFLADDIGDLTFLQRIRSRAWIGEEISGEEGSSEDGQIVYVTPTGTVYHTTKDCSYLDLSVTSISYDSVSSARNKSGSKYSACSYCCKSSSYETVYITDYGTSYHSTLSCSRLKRTIIAIDISEVGDRTPCSKCGGD